jgi:hypothetical protein
MQWHECNKHNYLCINDSLKFYFLVKIRVLQKWRRVSSKMRNYRASRVMKINKSLLRQLHHLGLFLLPHLKQRSSSCYISLSGSTGIKD